MNPKIVVAIDSFKGSMTSLEAGASVAEGIRRVCPNASVQVFPIADGGEGTTEALVSGLHGEMHTVCVRDPLGNPIQAMYGGIGKTAVLEMASAAGLSSVPKEARDPMKTSTYGVGEMISDALRRGYRDFLIGIGGSATNDGGVGMLSALGFSFERADGTPVSPGAKGLSEIALIKTENAWKELSECTFRIACDVTNPLCGKNGCSYVFAPQKGAKESDLPLMDAAMASYATATKKVLPFADASFPGAGAAGGLGFAFRSYLNAELRSGISLVLEQICIAEAMEDCDLVITGEGRLDRQTVMGKAPVGVAELAKKYGKPVIAFSGCADKDASVCNRHGIDAFFPILRTPCSLDEAMDPKNASENMKDCAEQVFRLWWVAKKDGAEA